MTAKGDLFTLIFLQKKKSLELAVRIFVKVHIYRGYEIKHLLSCSKANSKITCCFFLSWYSLVDGVLAA